MISHIVYPYTFPFVCLPIIICGLFIPKYEIILSVANTKIDPSRKPPATGINAYSPLAPYICDETANSIAGANNDQNDAAIITPAAKPSAISNDFRCALNENQKTNKKTKPFHYLFNIIRKF